MSDCNQDLSSNWPSILWAVTQWTGFAHSWWSHRGTNYFISALRGFACENPQGWKGSLICPATWLLDRNTILLCTITRILTCSPIAFLWLRTNFYYANSSADICNVWVTESTLFRNYRFCDWHCHCSTPPMPSGRFPCYCRDDTYDTIILWCWLANKQLREHYSDCPWFNHILM